MANWCYTAVGVCRGKYTRAKEALFLRAIRRGPILGQVAERGPARLVAGPTLPHAHTVARAGRRTGHAGRVAATTVASQYFFLVLQRPERGHQKDPLLPA